MSKSIPTVRRAKWHRKSDKWQVQNEDGDLCSCSGLRPEHGFGGWTRIPFTLSDNPWNFGPNRKKPKDYTKTLRRIIDAPKDKRVANKKRKA